MKVIAIVVASFWLAGAAMAQGTMAPPAPSPAVSAGNDCKTQAAKLSGAAMTSKVTSCCKKAAAAKKLHGAAATTFDTACVNAAKGM
jgi:hypothetical protein